MSHREPELTYPLAIVRKITKIKKTREGRAWRSIFCHDKTGAVGPDEPLINECGYKNAGIYTVG
jgi:hypothetical protein